MDLPGYDSWLASPYTDQIDPPECPTCGAWMEWEEDGDEDGRFLSTWCVNSDCEDAE